jgi:hypothetical protein
VTRNEQNIKLVPTKKNMNSDSRNFVGISYWLQEEQAQI